MMKYQSEYIKTLASGGSATPNLNKSQFEKIKITMPPESRLGAFDEKVLPIFEQIIGSTEEIQILTTLRDTLLPRLISGKVKL